MKANILLIEKNNELNEIVSELLEKNDFIVKSAKSFSEGIQILCESKNQFDIIISNYVGSHEKSEDNFFDMFYDVLCKIQLNDKLILLTGYVDNKKTLDKYKVCEILHKPLGMDKIVGVVKSKLNKKS